LQALLDDPTSIVRGAAIWAIAELDRDLWHAERARRLPCEKDEDVAAEWRLADTGNRR
jgi:epoxyqueuosine reductase